MHTGTHTYRDAQQRPLQTRVHSSLCPAACPSPPGLAHYWSSHQQGPPGACACCHLLTQTWQSPVSRPSIIQEAGCQAWIGTGERDGKPAGSETPARPGPGAQHILLSGRVPQSPSLALGSHLPWESLWQVERNPPYNYTQVLKGCGKQSKIKNK